MYVGTATHYWHSEEHERIMNKLAEKGEVAASPECTCPEKVWSVDGSEMNESTCAIDHDDGASPLPTAPDEQNVCEVATEVLQNCAAHYCHPESVNPDNPQWRINMAIANAAKIINRYAEACRMAGAASPTAPELELERESDGRWIAEFTRFPGVMAYGSTEEEAMRNAAKILASPTAPDEQAPYFKDDGWEDGNYPVRSELIGVPTRDQNELRKAWEQGRDEAANLAEPFNVGIDYSGTKLHDLIKTQAYPGSVSAPPTPQKEQK